VKLDPVMVEWLDAAAAVRGVDRSECLRRLIAAHMTRPSVPVCHHRQPCRYGCNPEPAETGSASAPVFEAGGYVGGCAECERRYAFGQRPCPEHQRRETA
jgi:hypothetical protein